MSKILIVGDVHGRWEDLNVIINQAIKKYQVSQCIQVGDFGFYKNVFIKNSFIKFSVPVMVIDGNHEDHDFILESISNENIEKWKTNHNIHFIKRGEIKEIDGCKFGFMGGALNVDRKQYGSIDEETTNYPTNKQILKAIKDFNSFGKLDFLITHSNPHSIGVGMQGSPYFFESIEKFITKPLKVSTGPIHDVGEQTLKNLWDGLQQKPSNWIFGHHHTVYQRQVDQTTFTCIGSGDLSDGKAFTLPFVIDTEKKILDVHVDCPLYKSSWFHTTRLLEKNDYPI